jgi:hypothetical protein
VGATKTFLKKAGAVASWTHTVRPSSRPSDKDKKKKKKAKFFSLRPEAPRIQLNWFLLTFKYEGGERISHQSLFRRLFEQFFSPLELEYIRWRQDQELTAVRRASIFAMIMTLFFLVAAFNQSSSSFSMSINIEKGKREYEFTSLFMMLVCIAFTYHIYTSTRAFFVLRYNLLIPTTLWIFVISHCHLARALMYPSSISFYQYSIGWLHPFWIACMSTGVGLTFSFFLFASSCFTASHVLTLYHLRARYMHGEFVELSDTLAKELSEMQSQYDGFGASLTDFTGFGGLWLFTIGTWVVFSYISRESDIQSRNHFIQLKRLNQMDAQRVRLIVDWGAGIAKVSDNLKTRFGRAGAVLFRYELPFEIDLQALVKGKMIGKGAAGTVYKGYFGRTPVAIKSVCISDLGALDPEAAVEEAKGEATILGKLTHENILKFHGVCADSDNLYIVTELCAGDLRERIYAAGSALEAAAAAGKPNAPDPSQAWSSVGSNIIAHITDMGASRNEASISVQEMLNYMVEVQCIILYCTHTILYSYYTVLILYCTHTILYSLLHGGGTVHHTHHTVLYTHCVLHGAGQQRLCIFA